MNVMSNEKPNSEDSIESDPFEMGPEEVEYPPVLRLTLKRKPANPRTIACASGKMARPFLTSSTFRTPEHCGSCSLPAGLDSYGAS